MTRSVLDLAADLPRDRSSDPGDDRLNSRLADLRETFHKLPGLEVRERRALRLRFILGLDHEVVAARMGFSGAFLKGVGPFRRPKTPRSLRKKDSLKYPRPRRSPPDPPFELKTVLKRTSSPPKSHFKNLVLYIRDFGGRHETRTRDLLVANEALFQLS